MSDNPKEPVENDGTESATAPKWFLIVSIVFLLWNVLGLMAFFMQVLMSEDALKALPEDQQTLYENLPIWVNIAFACAVIGGTLGCIGLLLKKKWALPLFVISILGVLVQNSYSFLMSDVVKVMGPAAVVMPLVVIAIGIGLVFLSKSAISKGWLN